MKAVAPSLFVGNAADYEDEVRRAAGWAVVHAAKEPYHRKLVGYRERSVGRAHPEYFAAERDHRLALNMVDSDAPDYFCREPFDHAVRFITAQLAAGRRVLVHCNQGRSRGPAVALFYLRTTDDYRDLSLAAAEAQLRAHYPDYAPGRGIAAFLRQQWGRSFFGIPEALYWPALSPSAIPVVLVCGPVAAGKTSYVAANKAPGDTVIDLDAIAAANGDALHGRDSERLREALVRRNATLATLAHATTGCAWFIVSAPRAEDRARWMHALGTSRCVVLATPAAVCKARVVTDPLRAADGSAQIHAIDRWWERYTPHDGDVVVCA